MCNQIPVLSFVIPLGVYSDTHRKVWLSRRVGRRWSVSRQYTKPSSWSFLLFLSSMSMLPPWNLEGLVLADSGGPEMLQRVCLTLFKATPPYFSPLSMYVVYRSLSAKCGLNPVRLPVFLASHFCRLSFHVGVMLCLENKTISESGVLCDFVPQAPV